MVIKQLGNNLRISSPMRRHRLKLEPRYNVELYILSLAEASVTIARDVCTMALPLGKHTYVSG